MKHIFMLLAFLLALSATMTAQLVVKGGGGVCHIVGDPNLDGALRVQDQRYECTISKDTTNGTFYVYNSTLAVGSRWVPIVSVTDTDTRLDNPRVVGVDLVFDLLNVKNNTVITTQTVPIASIAPVQSVVGSGDITVSGTTTRTVSYTDPDKVVGNEGVLSSSQVNATTVRVVSNSPGSSNIDLVATGPNITITKSGDALQFQVVNLPVVPTIIADNYTAAAAAGVAVGSEFFASQTNTMGAVPGTRIRRPF